MKSISLQKTINAGADKIFTHITEQDKLMLWFAPQVIAAPLKDTVAAFAFGSDVNFKMKISEFKQDKLIQWTCIDGNVDWLNSMVNFSLKAEGDGKTILKFRHHNLEENEKYEHWKSSWKSYLDELKNLCEQE